MHYPTLFPSEITHKYNQYCSYLLCKSESWLKKVQIICFIQVHWGTAQPPSTQTSPKREVGHWMKTVQYGRIQNDFLRRNQCLHERQRNHPLSQGWINHQEHPATCPLPSSLSQPGGFKEEEDKLIIIRTLCSSSCTTVPHVQQFQTVLR